MPISITVFGVSCGGTVPTLCYVSLRTVRGPGSYPAPTLPGDVATDSLRRITVPDSKLDLVTWDKIVPATEEASIQDGIERGHLTIPADCPIAGSHSIVGLPFGPLMVLDEGPRRTRISGSGVLYRKGIASDAPLRALKEMLNRTLGPGVAPKALQGLIARIGEVSGISEIFKRLRPIGVVDQLYRVFATTGVDGGLFDIVPGKLDFRTKAPMLQVHIRRHAAPLDQKFRCHIALKNYDEVLRSCLLEIEAGAPEITVAAPAHITDVSLVVFDDTGKLVDQLNGAFTQGIQFGLSVLGQFDALPPSFPGSPQSPDLEQRPRLHTVAFEGPSIADRSGGLDVIRKEQANVAALIGPLSSKFENVWFDRGPDGQVEVIRWIKKKIEQPEITKAYLFDPYLGSEALQRVVARQGNQTASLFIVISPGGIDPDADSAGSAPTSDYLAKLIRTATEWADKLADRISVVHVKRGDGSKQAFHDRYLCLVDQRGVPTAYLLSNSLSKAAGDWPFAICELDRVMSWRVYAYILEMVEGRADDRELRPEVIWKSEDTSAAPQVSKGEGSTAAAAQPAWVAFVNAFLTDLWNIIIRNSDFRPQVGARVEAFLQAWPQDMDEDALAEALFKVVSHRDAIVVFVSDALRAGGHPEIADVLDDKLLDRFLGLLPGQDQKGGWFVPFDARRTVLMNIGRTVARKQNATNVVRAKLNPKVHEYMEMIETQRLEEDISWDVHEASLFLSIIALEVAIDSKAAPVRFRIGLATDYIHWLGRLMRSDVAVSVYVAEDNVPQEWKDDLAFAAEQVTKARQALGQELDMPIGRIKDDPWVAKMFKEQLGSYGTS